MGAAAEWDGRGVFRGGCGNGRGGGGQASPSSNIRQGIKESRQGQKAVFRDKNTNDRLPRWGTAGWITANQADNPWSTVRIRSPA